MKASLKLREEQRPLVRAKLPLNILGLPLFTGVTSGDQRELALHLGTAVQAGPSFRVSYKPNNVACPFSVLVRTGFGLWGSPNGALAMSAEFNLNSVGSPSFSIRLKPKVGDLGVVKDSGTFKASYQKVDVSGGSGDEIAMGIAEQTKSVDSSVELNGREDDARSFNPSGKSPALTSRHAAAISNGDHHGKALSGLGTGSGAFVMEKVESFSNGTPEKSDTFDKEYVKRISERGSHDEGVSDEQVADSDEDVTGGALSGRAEESIRVRTKSWFGAGSGKGWKFNAHSSLPLGKWAVGRVRWQVKFGSNLFHDVRHGLHITDIKLPSLTLDKISFEAVNSQRNGSSGSDLAPLGFGYGDDESSQLGRIAAMCTSMRYQLQLLHLENKLLKSTIDEWRGDVRRPGLKGSELMIQEDTALRSQMFDELHGKSKSKNREGRKDPFSTGDSQSSSKSSGGKAGSSTGEGSAANSDASEELQKAIMNANGGSFGP